MSCHGVPGIQHLPSGSAQKNFPLQDSGWFNSDLPVAEES